MGRSATVGMIVPFWGVGKRGHYVFWHPVFTARPKIACRFDGKPASSAVVGSVLIRMAGLVRRQGKTGFAPVLSRGAAAYA